MTLLARNGETEIIGPIVDPSHLQGLLKRIARVGLSLRRLNLMEAENAEPATQTRTHQPGQPQPSRHLFEGTVNS